MPHGGARPNSGPKPRSLHDRALTNVRIPRLDGLMPENVLTMPPSAPPPQTGLDDDIAGLDLWFLGYQIDAFALQLSVYHGP